MPSSGRASQGNLCWACSLSLLLHLFFLNAPAHQAAGNRADTPPPPLEALLAAPVPGTARPNDQDARDRADARPERPAAGSAPPQDAAGTGDRIADGMPSQATAAVQAGDESPAGHHRLFHPSSSLQRPPLPLAAPQFDKFLADIDMPPVPISLRLYIDARGSVVDIEPADDMLLDERQLAKVKTMFYATPFIPGHLNGRDVPSFMNITAEMSDFAH